jgi:hypothetical protein
MIKSGYVLAGFETLTSIVGNFVHGKKPRFDNNFTPADISKFLSNTCSGFLHSYGQNFPNKKKYDKYNKIEADMYDKCRAMGIFDDCTFIVDSGGFQISTGQLTRTESDLLYKMYYEFIEEHHHVFQKAFILDVPPGPGCEIFKDFTDVCKLNLDSYQKARSLPDEIRKKIIYIHHFRTPQLWDIYTSIMRENDMFNAFEYHGTGGIVANMASDMSIPCIIYVLPLIPLINECKKFKRNYLNFHILGGANFRDVMFYELFKECIKQEHNIDLNITYDSSSPYKQVMHARFIYTRDKFGNIRKLNIKSKNLDKKFALHNMQRDITVVDEFQEGVNRLADKWNWKRINVDGLYGMYEDRSGNMVETFHPDVKAYATLYSLNFFAEVQEEMRQTVQRIYPIYKDGLTFEFNSICEGLTRLINQGSVSKKQLIKAQSISNSLDMLRNLDEEYCKYIVVKGLAKDEFKELNERTKVDIWE